MVCNAWSSLGSLPLREEMKKKKVNEKLRKRTISCMCFWWFIDHKKSQTPIDSSVIMLQKILQFWSTLLSQAPYREETAIIHDVH